MFAAFLAPPPVWRTPSLAELLGVAAFGVLCLWVHWFSADGWVWLVDNADLAIHEAGHPLLGILSRRLSVYGGTLFQLLFPALTLWHFRHRGEATGAAAAAVWLGQNGLNIARYMADARAQVLPLVGGGEHDWTEIFQRWGVLQSDSRIAGLTALASAALIVYSLRWLYLRWRQGAALDTIAKLEP
jgi:hypothetical protein